MYTLLDAENIMILINYNYLCGCPLCILIMFIMSNLLNVDIFTILNYESFCFILELFTWYMELIIVKKKS